MLPRSFVGRSFFPLVLVLAAGSLAAQVPPAFLVGGTVRSPTNSSELVQMLPCAAPGSFCTQFAVPFATPSAGELGGAAYDPGYRECWLSNGVELISASMDFPCDLGCGVTASPVANTSGLAFDTQTRTLWILGSGGELAETNFPFGGCPEVVSRCSLASQIPTGAITAGLAFSDVHRLLFVAVSTVGANPRNFVYVTTPANPCQLHCVIDLGAPFGNPQASPVTGLGYDDGSDELFAVCADAGITRARLSISNCTIAAQSTCVPPGNARLFGLCVQPQAVRIIGRSCESPPCTRCGLTRLFASDPSIGNPLFSIAIRGTPVNSLAIPVASLGPCTSGVPFFCGTAYVALTPPPIVLPPMLMSGPGSACHGTGVIPMPIPADPNLSGFEFCFQAGIVCPTGGTGITEAMQVRVGGA